ncbi:MAG: hypothetical protein JXR76_16190 [Deltaproteobacteria bacterium]|nr:hypothetical protein [Deltaproteobacteria bacterium]
MSGKKSKTRQNNIPLDTLQISNPLVCDRLNESVYKAIRHCIQSQNENGAWLVYPDPRAFETALIGYALDCSPAGECSLAVDKAKNWLRTTQYQQHSTLANMIEHSVASFCLRRPTPIDLTMKELTAPEYKNRMLLLYALALHAQFPVKSAISPENLCALVAEKFNLWGSTKMKQWHLIEVAAVCLLLKARFSVPVHSGSALNILTTAQAANGSYFSNPVATALAYIALCEAAMDSPERLKCRQYLLDEQHQDGTWRFCTSNLWDTVLTIRSFRGHPLFDKVALPSACLFLLKEQNPDGGWAFSSDVESDNDTTSAAILALRGIAAAEESIKRALSFLAEYQQQDGLWRTWRTVDDPPVEDVNAHVLSALNETADWHSIRRSTVREWLSKRYQLNGQWTPSWYYGVPYAISEVSEALGVENVHVTDALKKLASIQNPDGGWGTHPNQPSRASTTAQMLLAFMRQISVRSILSMERIEQALLYIFEQQDDNGMWPGLPEMYGPRPLLSHYQTHTQAFVVRGLLAVQQRLV